MGASCLRGAIFPEKTREGKTRSYSEQECGLEQLCTLDKEASVQSVHTIHTKNRTMLSDAKQIAFISVQPMHTAAHIHAFTPEPSSTRTHCRCGRDSTPLVSTMALSKVAARAQKKAERRRKQAGDATVTEPQTEVLLLPSPGRVAVGAVAIPRAA